MLKHRSESKEAMAFWITHPAEFVEYMILGLSVEDVRNNMFGKRLEPESRTILNSVVGHDYIAIPAGRGVTKTFSFAMLIIWWLYTRKHARVAVTGPKFDQLKITLWAEINKWINYTPVTSAAPAMKDQLNWTAEKICHTDECNDAFGFMLTSKDKENIAGVHANHVLWIADEASNIDTLIFETIFGGLNDPEAKFIMGGNPTKASGVLFDAAFGKDRASWHIINLSSENSTRARTNKIWWGRMQKYPRESDVFRVNVLGLPPRGNPRSIISLEECCNARDREIQQGNYIELGVDPASEGDDLCTIAVRIGLVLKEIRCFPKTKAPEICNHVINVVKEYRAKTRITSKIRVKIDDSVTGDVPVYIRRDKRFIDVVPIMSLHNTKNYKSIAHSKYEILSQDGWTNVVYSYRHNVNKKGFDIVTGNGRTKVTEDHSLMINKKEEKPGDINIGDKIDIYKPEIINNYSSFSEDFAWVLGFFAAEGNLAKPHNCAYQVCISNQDLTLLNKSKVILESFFGKSCKIQDSCSNCNKLIVVGEMAHKFFLKYCYTETTTGHSKNDIHETVKIKKVPIQILNASSNIKQAFLDGYIAGDGTNDRGYIKSDCKELTLSAGIQYLYYCLGIKTSVRVRCDEKTNITTIAKIKGQSQFEENEVKRKREFQINDYVYDLETESHTFVAGLGWLVHHNTGYGQAVRQFLALDDKNNIEVVPCLFNGKGNEEYKDYATIMWYEFRDLINDVSLPNDEELIEELASRESQFIGQNCMRVEPKRDYKTRIGRSPDRADACILCFTKGPTKVLSSRAESEEATVKDFEIDWKKEHLTNPAYSGVLMIEAVNIAALVLNRDLSFNGLAAIYQFIQDKLWIYREFYQETPIPDKIARVVAVTTQQGMYEDDRNPRIMGNELMFRQEGDRRPLADVLKKENLHVIEPLHYDEFGAIALGIKMFHEDKITMHKNLQKSRIEINLWSIKKGTTETERNGYCKALLLILSEVRRQTRTREPIATAKYISPYSGKSGDYHPVAIEEIKKENLSSWMAK